MNTVQTQLAEANKLVVITHTQADLDAVGSAVGLAAAIDGMVHIAVPGGVQSKAEALLEDYTVVDDPELASYDVQIVVDAPSTDRIAPLDPTVTETPLVLIDHHEPGDLQAHATASVVDTDAWSTALLIFRILRKGDWAIDESIAMALAAGTLDDTGFRGIVLPGVREELITLLDQAGDTGDQLASFWDTEPTWSERMATVKAIDRARGYKAGETVLFISNVGGQESAAAHALLKGNGDIAIILSERGDELRVIARMSDRLRGSLSLPEDLLHPLVEEFGGHAGGHAGAAGAKLKAAPFNEVKTQIVQCLEKALGLQFGTLS